MPVLYVKYIHGRNDIQQTDTYDVGQTVPAGKVDTSGRR